MVSPKLVGSLAGKVVVVTGGTAGLGRAIARAFSARGASVAVLARDQGRLQATETELRANGRRALAIMTDVADSDAVEAAAERVENELGPIDIWVNNAMTTVFSRVDKLTHEEFKRVTEVTYLGSVYGTLAALRRMRPRRRGVIVQVGSALAYRAIPLQSAYCGAKHGLRGFTNAVRCELMHDKLPIHITMVHMPGLNTPQFDWCKSHMPRKAQPVDTVFQPEVGAEAVVWAALHRRRELLVGWPTVKTVLGNKLLPKLGDTLAASEAYEPQMSPVPEDPNRPYNLFHPVARSVAAHGRFDDRSHARSLSLWVGLHKKQLALAGSLVGLGSALLLRRRAA